MTQDFAVTFDLVTQESAAHGDYADSGFLGRDLTFRAAFDLFQSERDWTHVEADEWPVRSPRWFTDSGEVQFASGDCRAVSLHLPERLTNASRLRIARLVHCHGLPKRPVETHQSPSNRVPMGD